MMCNVPNRPFNRNTLKNLPQAPRKWWSHPRYRLFHPRYRLFLLKLFEELHQICHIVWCPRGKTLKFRQLLKNSIQYQPLQNQSSRTGQRKHQFLTPIRLLCPPILCLIAKINNLSRKHPKTRILRLKRQNHQRKMKVLHFRHQI